MRRIQFALFAAFAVIGFGSLASAADMPVKASRVVAYNWNGWYAGITGGWTGGGSNDVTFLPPAAGTASSGGISGATLGGMVGYNWQFTNLVLGLEGDFSWSNAASTVAAGGAGCGGATFACTDKMNWLGTLRGRAGFTAGATGNWLIYGTGGAAWGSIRRYDTESITATSVTETNNNWGWTGGAGVEVGLTPRWTVRAEALYVDLSNSRVYPTAIGAATFANENINDKFGLYRIGAAYKF